MSALTVSPNVQSQGDGERILKRVEQRARSVGRRGNQMRGELVEFLSAEISIGDGELDALKELLELPQQGAKIIGLDLPQEIRVAESSDLE